MDLPHGSGEAPRLGRMKATLRVINDVYGL